ncbi:hypothetical protein [Nocardia australiensis]|uniref:hypothetical protein n=1 Tax=Nocardia australiensis TaxID=2887191 RepID=UPI001D1399DD|nr:hypothetical protein [Nocardia australiensis]
MLVRKGEEAGLCAVLEVLGHRSEDPDSDYIAYRLRELQIFDQVPILQNARLLRDLSSENVRDGLGQLEELFGREV